LTDFGQRKSCEKGFHNSHACTLREISKAREGIHTGYDNGKTLKNWEPMELKYSKF